MRDEYDEVIKAAEERREIVAKYDKVKKISHLLF